MIVTNGTGGRANLSITSMSDSRTIDSALDHLISTLLWNSQAGHVRDRHLRHQFVSISITPATVLCVCQWLHRTCLVRT